MTSTNSRSKLGPKENLIKYLKEYVEVQAKATFNLSKMFELI